MAKYIDKYRGRNGRWVYVYSRKPKTLSGSGLVRKRGDGLGTGQVGTGTQAPTKSLSNRPQGRTTLAVSGNGVVQKRGDGLGTGKVGTNPKETLYRILKKK